MTLSDLTRQVREQCGNPDQNTVPNSRLEPCIDRALNWLAAKLKFERHTEEQSIALVAGEQHYALPPDLAWIVWLEHNKIRLRPKSTYEWDRDSIDYHHESPATPQEFAVSARVLILRPMPAAGDVLNSPFIVYRGIFSAPTMPEAGLAGLGELDYQLLIYLAAVEYLGPRPSDENTVRVQFCQRRIEELLPAAQNRAAAMPELFYPRWRPEVTRFGGAR